MDLLNAYRSIKKEKYRTIKMPSDIAEKLQERIATLIKAPVRRQKKVKYYGVHVEEGYPPCDFSNVPFGYDCEGEEY